MATKWIDEQTDFNVGDSAFLIEFSNENSGADSYVLRNTPAYTNQSREPRLHGWCGSYNNVSTSGRGAWEVVRIAKSGRFLIRSLDGFGLVAFLEEMGYPELIQGSIAVILEKECRSAADVMERADTVGAEANQDLENETTTYTFSDGSQIVVSGPTFTVVDGEK